MTFLSNTEKTSLRFTQMSAERKQKKGPQNYDQLRAALIRRGYSLRSWAATAGYPVTTVYGAARGERSGIKAVKIRTELEEFAYAK